MSSVEYSILDEIRRLNRNLENIAHELRVANTHNAEAARITREACELIKKEKDDGGENL